MAESLRDHQESNESEVCDDVIDVPNPIPSLLDKLKCPDLARKRKIKTNPSGKKRCKGAVASEPHVSPLTRVREYPNEFLGVVSGKLFCKACRETISVKKSVTSTFFCSC